MPFIEACIRNVRHVREVTGRWPQRYILTFTPHNVATHDGWHELEVRVRADDGSTVRARRGYWRSNGCSSRLR